MAFTLSSGALPAARADECNGDRSCVVSLGDVDADLVPDLLVSARGNPLAGSAWVVSGRDGRVIHSMRGREPRDGFGSSLSGVGDFEGDGIPDAAVGASGWDGATRMDAYARIVSGKNGTTLYDIPGGWVVAPLDDLDGDGRPDLVVSRPTGRRSEVNVHSGVDGHRLHPVSPPGPNVPWGFGTSMIQVADLDGDHVRDLAVGSLDLSGPLGPSGTTSPSRRLGCVSFHSGADGRSLFAIEGNRGNDVLGWSLCDLGDLDGDGISELGVGALHREVRVLSVKHLEPIQSVRSLGGLPICDGFASSLDTLGDVDFDCVPDWLVGANEDSSFFDFGYAWVVSGRTGSILRRLFRAPEEGVDVCRAGDVDGDGVPDVAMAVEGKWDPLSVWEKARVPPRDRLHELRLVSGRTWKVLWQRDLVELDRLTGRSRK